LLVRSLWCNGQILLDTQIMPPSPPPPSFPSISLIPVSGTGTTTATILTRSIFREGCKAVAAGMNPTDVRRGIEMSVKAVVEELTKMAVKVEGTEKIAQVATISANGEADVGNLLAEAMEKVTKDGVITIREAAPLEQMSCLVPWKHVPFADRHHAILYLLLLGLCLPTIRSWLSDVELSDVGRNACRTSSTCAGSREGRKGGEGM
jgi:predicted aspartyl protease